LEPQAVQTWRAPQVTVARFNDAQQLCTVQAMASPPVSASEKQGT
jgi:hypothetical protein